MKLVCSFDDGAAEDMRLFDLCQKYELTDVTFYIPADWEAYNEIEGREGLSLMNLLTISSQYEIGSHTITHPLLTRVPIQTAEFEIVTSKELLESIIDKPVNSFCYPRGYANDEIRDIVRKHYKTARNTLIGSIMESEDPVWQSTTVHVGGKRRTEYQNTTWLDEGLRLLEMASNRRNSVYHLWGHSWELTRERGWDDLEILLREVSSV